MDFRRIIMSLQWQSWRWTIKLALIAVAFTLLTIFVADNFVMVETRFVFWSLETRLAWSLLVAAGMGFWIGVLVSRLRR